MLVIPMDQPYASAVCLGLKKIETRGRKVPHDYRGQVAIHANKRWDQEICRIIDNLPDRIGKEMNRRSMELYGSIDPILGKIIAMADLIDCCPTIGVQYPGVFEAHPDLDTPTERALGNYAQLRYGWVLANVKPLVTPLPYRAHQGVYLLDEVNAMDVRRRLHA